MHHDLDLVLRTIRDVLSPEFKSVWVDSVDQYQRIVEFLDQIQPNLVSRVRLYRRDEPIFAALEHSGVGDAARFLGSLGENDLPVLYSHAGVFVLPSLYEGFGLPVLEAMACGAPVVCSNAGPLPEEVDTLLATQALRLLGAELRVERILVRPWDVRLNFQVQVPTIR